MYFKPCGSLWLRFWFGFIFCLCNLCSYPINPHPFIVVIPCDTKWERVSNLGVTNVNGCKGAFWVGYALPYTTLICWEHGTYPKHHSNSYGISNLFMDFYSFSFFRYLAGTEWECSTQHFIAWVRSDFLLVTEQSWLQFKLCSLWDRGFICCRFRQLLLLYLPSLVGYFYNNIDYQLYFQETIPLL